MIKSLTPLIAANWKMHGLLSWHHKPAEFDKLLPKEARSHIEMLLCPPAHMLPSLSRAATPVGIYTGGQNCHDADSGAHTGEISALMLKDAGASYVIIGHSERRAAGESDAQVKAKSQAAHAAGLTPIICVGESLTQREAGQAVSVVQAQISNCLPDIDCVIAYEPIWAIGTGKVPTMDDIAQIHAAIRKQVGPEIRLLYGGSVKPANAGDILSVPHVNGALIGGASLEMDSLAAIVKAAPKP